MDYQININDQLDFFKRIIKDNKEYASNFRVPKNGFFWDADVEINDENTGKIESNTLQAPYLLEEPFHNSDDNYRIFNPSKKERYLFWEFSNLPYITSSKDEDMIKDKILNFANQYGSLTNRGVKVYSEKYSCNPKKISRGQDSIKFMGEHYLPAYAESLVTWVIKIIEMKSLVLLWKSLVKDDLKLLRKIIRWEKDKIRYIIAPSLEILNQISKKGKFPSKISSKFTDGILAEKNNNGEMGSLDGSIVFEDGDIKRPARFLLTKLVGDLTKKYFYDSCKEGELPILFDKDDLKIHPQDLLSYIWYEFHSLTKENKEIGWCKLCGGPEDTTDKRLDWKSHKICRRKKNQKKYRDLNAYEEDRKTKQEIVESWKDSRWKLEVTAEDVEKWIEDRNDDNEKNKRKD